MFNGLVVYIFMIILIHRLDSYTRVCRRFIIVFNYKSDIYSIRNPVTFADSVFDSFRERGPAIGGAVPTLHQHARDPIDIRHTRDDNNCTVVFVCAFYIIVLIPGLGRFYTDARAGLCGVRALRFFRRKKTNSARRPPHFDRPAGRRLFLPG